MDILFPPKNAHSRRRCSSDMKSSRPASVAKDKQIRQLSQEKNSKLLLSNSYIYKPPNNISVSDTQEVSLQLSIFRRIYDRLCLEWNKQNAMLASLTQELERIMTLDKKQESSKEKSAQKVDNLTESIEKTKFMQIDEEENREICFHMLDRMRMTIVSLKSKSLEYKFSLHNKSFTLLIEQELSTKAKESRARTVGLVSRLKRTIDLQTVQEKKEVESLEKTVEKRRIISLNRNEQRKKQAEIIENAIIESQSSGLEEFREKYFLNKLWYTFSTLRYENEKKNSHKYEEAYQRIKLNTGITEAPMFVVKFLSREKNYEDLRESVRQKEVALEIFNKKIQNIQRNIDKFSSTGDQPSNNNSFIQKMHSAHKENRELMIKKNSLVQIYAKIDKWVERMKERLIANSKDSIFSTQLIRRGEQDFRDRFGDIRDTVVEMLKGLNKPRFFEENKKKENLQAIIEDIPERSRSFRKLPTLFDSTMMLNIESEVTVKYHNK